MTPEKAPDLCSLTVSCNWESLLRDNFKYRQFYRVQVDAAALIANSTLDWPLQTLAHMSYGWMPRILGRVPVPDGMTEASIVRDVARWTSVRDARTWVETQSLPDGPPINGSWIGTSKAFHFLAPDAVPIWDSRVARHFGYTSHAQVNNTLAFSGYLTWTETALERFRDEIAAFRTCHETQWGYDVTPVRAVELMLFLSASVCFPPEGES